VRKKLIKGYLITSYSCLALFVSLVLANTDFLSFLLFVILATLFILYPPVLLLYANIDSEKVLGRALFGLGILWGIAFVVLCYSLSTMFDDMMT
jgi:hypothetical protein